MDMDMSGMDSSIANSTMTTSDLTTMVLSMMQFHASGGDTLWFPPFIPISSPAIFGACILLFFIAILTRFLDAIQRTMTLIWATSEQTGMPASWKPAHELPRGILFMFQSGFLYLLMLAVMCVYRCSLSGFRFVCLFSFSYGRTYNAYYFVAILIGLGVGEAFFGRFGRPILRCSPNSNNNTDKLDLIDSPNETPSSCCGKNG